MKNQINFLRFLKLLLLTVLASNFSFAQTSTATITISSTAAGSIDYYITGATASSTYTIYFESTSPTVTVGSTYSPAFAATSETITTDPNGEASSSTSSATFSGTYYYAVLVDNNSEVVAVDPTGSSVTATSSAAITISSTAAGSIDYSITGADMTAGYTIYYENATPTTTVGSTYTTGTLSESITTGAGGTASGTSTVTFTSSGTYYAILVDNTTFQVAAVDNMGSYVTVTASSTASISTSVSTTAGSIDYSITGADMTAGYTIYYENATPTTTVGSTYTTGTLSESITTGAGGTASGTSTVTFTSSGTYYAILVDNTTFQVAAVDNMGTEICISPTISGTTSVCVDATTTLTGSGTAATTSPWASSDNDVATVSNLGLVTAVAAGSVTITYTDNNGCSATETVTVNALPSFTTDLNGTETLCSGSSLSVVASGTGTISYQWYESSDNSSWSAITSGVSSSYTPTSSQYYKVVGTDGTTNCTSTSAIVVVT
ncbi:Ig-like domain-containing protein, partial [Schleiferiaceae bacterium]|nr:Ig-like domain-containing protein [Schleiferiaceae bacterium]